MNTRVDQLEYTVMELGSEIFQLKHQMTEMNTIQESYLQLIHNLKSILEEKGVIKPDDFDAVVDPESNSEEQSYEGDELEFLSNASDKKELH